MKAKKARIKAFKDALTVTIIRDLNRYEMKHLYYFHKKAKKKSTDPFVQMNAALKKYRKSGARQAVIAEFFDGADGETSGYDNAIGKFIDANPELVKKIEGNVEKAIFAVSKKLYDETYFEWVSDIMLLDMLAGEPWTGFHRK